LRLYLEGTNFRRIGRILSVNHQSVVNWVNSYHASLPAAETAATKPEALEMDELFTFLGSKCAELLLGRLQHVPGVVLVGRAHFDVRQESDLLSRGRQRRPAPLSGTPRQALVLLLVLPPRAQASRGLVRALLQRTSAPETQAPALPGAAYSYDLDTPELTKI
jgi:hypothetical protein